MVCFRPRLYLALLALSIGLSLPLPSRAEEPGAGLATLSEPQLRDLLPSLRKGGYILYFRHAMTRQDQEDQQPVRLEDCGSQRNLSDEGRAQARKIGTAFHALGLPVGTVLSSPFCRTLETARLAFGQATPSDDLYFAIGLARPEREAKGAVLRRLLATPPPARTNTVLVAHTVNLQEAIGYWPKPEGAAFLIQPEGAGQFRVIGRVAPETWALTAASR